MEVPEVLQVEDENVLDNVIAKGNQYLKFLGLGLDRQDMERHFFLRLRYRKLFLFTFIFFNLDVCGQLKWLIGRFINGDIDLIDFTFLFPCLVIALLGFVKSFYFFKNVHHIHEIISMLKILKTQRQSMVRKKVENFEKRCLRFLNTADKVIKWVTILGLITFGVGPLLLTARIFYISGEIQLFFPFLFYYPFDAFDLKVYPFLYVQQLWSGWIYVCSMWGTDFICYTAATFIFIQYFSLKQDIINLFSKSNRDLAANNTHRVKLRAIVKCHIDILRCAGLIELTYTKSILFNVVFSSMMICCNMFNITTNSNIVVRAPTTAFLIMVLGQIFLLCYYGDMIMESSTELYDAINKSQWYRAKPALVRDLIIISLRANKPSKLTANGFSDVNLRTFTKILSTSWSYLALLQTVYDKNKGGV